VKKKKGTHWKSTVVAMDPVDILDLTADEHLLTAGNLPASVGQPEPLPPPSSARARIVAIGATLTGVTLLVGIVLVVAGVIGVVAGGSGFLALAALVGGLVLAGTHWGWVHVAEVTADSIEGRRNSDVLERQRRWLQAIKPYTRYEVTTSVDDDGSIRIVRARYEPDLAGEGRFTFSHTVEHEEVHSADEPSATVAERAELLRRQAAVDTASERERFEVVADAYETALLSADDEQQRQAARRAASEALSEQINANLREPPLVE
jgi:hypothetical protein